MNKRVMIKKLLSYTRGSGFKILMSFICSAVAAAIGILLPFYAGKAIDLIDGNNTDMTGILHILIFMIALIAIASLFQFAYININNRITYTITERIRNDSYGKINKLPISYIDKTSVGTIQSMVISDCETTGDGLLMFLNQFFSGIVSIIMIFVIMMIIDYKIALFVTIFTPVSFVVSYFIASRTYKSFKKQSSIRSKQTSFISEMTTNFRTIHAFNRMDSVCDDFSRINESYRKVSTRATFFSSITNPSTRFINALIYAGVAFIGAHQVLGLSLTVGALSSMLAYASTFMKPFNELSSVYTELSDSFACMNRIFEFLREEELDELSDDDSINPWSSDGDFVIEFKHVSFSYVPGVQILKNVSFKVDSGCSCAIVGPTGCGKTTIINLLMRFYEPDSGDIFVNNVNIKDIPRNTLRKYIGVVTQDTWFYNGQIIDNIKYGKTQISDEVAINTSMITGAHSFIRRLPNKYYERITAGREDISEGQRQLLSITRAMASDPSMLILDEATSSVDVVTEVKIQKAVKELLNGRTSIIIAHRLSTIIDADCIVVIENGMVSEVGNHNELMNNNGFYSKLYKSYIE